MNLKKVVVTGIGAVTPIGNGIDEFWKGLSRGVSGAALITKFDPTPFSRPEHQRVKQFWLSSAALT